MLHSDFLAYGHGRMELESIIRFQAVKRWHMIETSRIQTLAEHSANVAMLVHYFWAGPEPYWRGVCSDMVVHKALMHDLPEVFTGDVPTPTKQHISEAIKTLEKTVTASIYNFECNDHEALLIKMCDLADSIRFIKKYGVDATGEHAMRGLKAQFHKRHEAISLIAPDYCVGHLHETLDFYINA